MSEREFFDNTMCATHRRCERKFYFRHQRHLRPEGLQPALAFGLGWHSAMDVVWQELCAPDPMQVTADTLANLTAKAYLAWELEWCEQGYPSAEDMTDEQLDKLRARTPDTVIEMIGEYIEARKTLLSQWELVATERPFAVPLYPDRDDVWYCGRLDKVVRKSDGLYIIDHKTTTAYLKDGGFRATFTESFSPDSQMDGYAFAGHMIWPDEYKGVEVDGALVHKYVHDKFCMIPVQRGISKLDSWLWGARREVEKIRDNRERLADHIAYPTVDYMPAFAPDTHNCMDFQTKCAFMDFCKGLDDPALELTDESALGFTIDEWSPFTVNRLEDIGMGSND